MLSFYNRGRSSFSRSCTRFCASDSLLFSLVISLDCCEVCAFLTVSMNFSRFSWEYSAIAFKSSLISSMTTSALILCCVEQSVPTGIFEYAEQVYCELSFHCLPGEHTFSLHNPHNTSAWPLMCFLSIHLRIFLIASDPLDVIKGFLIHDRFLCVLEYCSLIFPDIMTFLILEMFSGFKVHRMTKVLSFLQNPYNSGGTPSIRIFDFIHPAFP